MTDETSTKTPPFPTLEDWQHWTWVTGRAQQMLGEAWDAMLDREYPSPAGTPRSGRGRMGVGANVPVGEVVIGPSPIDGSEGFTMVRWAKERGCPPVGTRLYAEKLHPANP